MKKDSFSLTLHRMLDGRWNCHCLTLGITAEGDTPLQALRQIANPIERAMKVRKSA